MKEDNIEKSIRRGITNAQMNEKSSHFIIGEFFIISIILGLSYSSWEIFGCSLLLFMIFSCIKSLATILVIILATCWGVIGYGIGTLFQSTGAIIVLSVLGFLFGLGIHISGFQWFHDLD